MPTATPFHFPPERQWGPDDIGTLVFGCIASVLAILTLWATFWLERRRALRTCGHGLYIHRPSLTGLLTRLPVDEGRQSRNMRDQDLQVECTDV